jgi:hypothetical protein
VRFESIRENIFEDILASVSVKPGSIDRNVTVELKPFQWRLEDDQYVVCLPTNLEQFADNWPVRCAVTACAIMQAVVRPSAKPLVEFKYLSEREEYLHGLAAALKLGTIKEDRTTGLFHQGFQWAVSRQMLLWKNKDLFRTNWRDPYYAVLGKEVWTGDAPDYIKYWHSLMIEASKLIKLDEPKNFARSYEEIVRLKMKHNFSYESKAVFSDYEVTCMSKFIDTPRRRLEDFKAAVKKDVGPFIEDFDHMYTNASKEVVEYDRRVNSIANSRATILFRTLGKKGQKNLPKNLSRDMRLELLGLLSYIKATNPTGLFEDDRSEFNINPQFSDDEIMEHFSQWRKSVQAKQQRNPLFDEWAEGIVPAKAKSLGWIASSE